MSEGILVCGEADSDEEDFFDRTAVMSTEISEKLLSKGMYFDFLSLT